MEPWPADLPEPKALGTSKVVRLPDGLYEARWPSGRRRLVAFVEGGRVRRWLTLEDGPQAGCLDIGNTAQRYSADGRMENFSPWDDSSPPYAAPISFRDWVAEALREVRGESPPLRPARPKPAPLPPPPLQEILDELATWPGDLRFRTELDFHLRDRFRLSYADSARIAEFLPLAFLWKRKPVFEHYLHPVWEGTYGCGLSPLEDVDVFREALRMKEGHPRVARNLVACASVPEEQVRPGLSPLVATPPPEPSVTCPLRVLEVVCELALRLEQGRGGAVPDDVEEAAAAGAYLLAPLAGAPLDYLDGVLPWDRHPEEFTAARARLARTRSRVLSGKMHELAPGLAPFFQERAKALRDWFLAFGRGRFAFPILCWEGPRWRPAPRDRWRGLAEEAMRFLPPDFPCSGPVDLGRMQNRLAEVGLHLAEEPVDRVEEYLARHHQPEPRVREAVHWFLDSEELDPRGWDVVNGVLRALESFEPGARARRERVVLATRMSRLLAIPLAR